MGCRALFSLKYASSSFNLCLPTIVSRQMTATHQLKTAVMSVAFAGRSLFFTSLSTPDKPAELGGGSGDDVYVDLLMISLSNALLGMDANDPPKTLATLQLIGSIFSNVSFKALLSFQSCLKCRYPMEIQVSLLLINL